MFRNGARVFARAAGAQQSRNLSSNTAQSFNRNKNFVKYAAVVLAIGVVAAQKPAENSWFGGSSETVKFNLENAKKDIIAAIEAEDAKRGDGTSIAPTLVRLAWHASGTYSIFDKTGGSCGATMRFSPEANWGANAGLKGARTFMEAIAKKHGMSYGDAWTLAGGKIGNSSIHTANSFILM
jgi:cytochrome c peroxidase